MKARPALGPKAKLFQPGFKMTKQATPEDGVWRTINGAHVFIRNSAFTGRPESGPDAPGPWSFMSEKDALLEYLGSQDPPEDSLFVGDGANGLLRGFSRYTRRSEAYTDAQRQYYEAQIKKLQSLIERTPTTEDRIFYRGVTKSLADQLTEGTMFTDKGFTSITTDRQIAQDRFIGFSPDEKGRVFEVHVPKGTPLVDVDLIANPKNDREYTTEREHILGHGTRFRVKNGRLEVIR